ncbi:proton pump-interactor 1 [Selaginella moellendorffii]|uniref:proton pump-interactor 1 n=1 Tax=Selaginella moellendorffii TaxID=88036 RepID=UPI000D1CF3DF|nr:proton pump-interactor 1 [Selaginella moellendorffii]XP_024527461.1 proton pump-interactor 1 [Selaginella moellendorffii]|eukprot:XP_024527455.1 proton pump-interactor 1 [Selaginella moellendorffii]
MGAVSEAIAADTAEKLHAVAAADTEEENHQAVEDEAPSSVDDAADGIEDHAESGILEEAVQRDNDENIAKAPIVGGATPSEASSEWPEQGFASCDPPGGVAAVAPTTKSVFTYYLVRIPKRGDNLVDFRTTTDAQVKDKIEKKNSLIAKLQQKRAEKQELLDKLVEPRNYFRECRGELQEKIEESKPVAAELKKINELPYAGMSNVCRSEEDLDAKLAGLEHDLQQLDRPLTLREEKQIIREIQALKATREQVIINASFRASKQDAKQGYQTRLKSLNEEIEELSKKKNLAWSKVKPLEDRVSALTEEIKILSSQRKALDEIIDEVFNERRSLSAQEYAKNNDFHQNRRDINTAKQLAYAKDTGALKEYCSAQVERVMELWNNDTSFRSEYMKNNLRSTIRRLATPDGRSLGPNEQPYELPKDEPPVAAPAPVVEEKEAPKPTLEVKAEPSKTAAKTKQKSDAKEAKEAGTKAKPVSEESENVVEAEDEVEAERAAISELAKQLERREVEIQKAKEAEARKKRQAEKKQAKAQARIEKELQRREKEREKRLRKKTSATDQAGEGADSPSEQEKENLEPPVAAENGEKPSPEEKKPSSVTRRGKKPAKNTPVKLQLRKKRSLQDHWQIIAAIGVALLVVLGATMVFVRAAY